VTEPRTLIGTLLAEHLTDGELEPGRPLELSVDQVLVEDATGSMTALQFEELGLDRVEVPLAVLYVDHNVLQVDDKNMDEHRYLRSFAARYGVSFSRPGNGISHYVHLERFAAPGGLLLGADSHSTMSGAVGMFALGAGGLDVALAMGGLGLSIPCPRVVGVELRGELGPWVSAKDVILELLRRRGTAGGAGCAFEFFGEGVATLSVLERGSICNMITEMGATAAVFPSDDRVREWLTDQGRADQYRELAAEPGATHDEHEVIDLADLVPLIACPSSPGNVVPVTEVAGTQVVQVCVGSSVNSSYDDLAVVGTALRHAVVHPSVEMTVTPGSRQILDRLVRGGVYLDLVAAGARMLEPVCGPCVGVGQAPSAGQPSVRTFNRNFPGRSGTVDDRVYLASPATAAATALHGRIVDPRELGEPPAIADPPAAAPGVDDGQIVAPLPPEEARRIEIVRSPHVVPPPRGNPMRDALEGDVLIVVGDDVSTGDMAPDGIGMSLWANIPECSRYMFDRLDPEFTGRAHERGGGFVVGGENYGQGSSREQAALAALYLGVRAVIARSFARIHRSNLVAQGVLPLTFVDPDDHGRTEQDEHWRLDGVRDAIADGASRITAQGDDGRSVELAMGLGDRERAVLLAGGTLNHLRGSGAVGRGS
jgi:aconitate hydratase